MGVVLWQIEISHYNEKARWALDYKRVPHERRTPMPGLHGLVALALTRGRHRRFPLLGLDGRRIGDSTAIIEALEAYRPDPPLYPTDPADRDRALALEDFFDEELAPDLRRFVWHHTLDDEDAVIDAVMPGASPARKRVLRAMAPIARPVVRADYGISEERAGEARSKVAAAMDRLEAELQPSGYLVGERFTVADLTAAALFTPVICPPQRQYAPRTLSAPVLELRAELLARPGGAWVTEMFARHRGESAEIGRS